MFSESCIWGDGLDAIEQIQEINSTGQFREFCRNLKSSHQFLSVQYHAAFPQICRELIIEDKRFNPSRDPSIILANPNLFCDFRPAVLAQPGVKLTDEAIIEENPITGSIADNGVKIIYPFHGSEQEKSALVIGFSVDEINGDKNSQSKITSITILLPYLHEAARRISYRESCRYEVESLSTREKQCLTMVAQGIVANNISEKLGVSNRTVKHHIDYGCCL